MNGKILIFNTGSTSLRYKIYELNNDDLITIKKGIVENIGQPTGPKNHKVALSILFQGFGLGMPYLGKIDNLIAIGHRVVHGGNEFDKTSLINKGLINNLKKYNSIAPLHNPHIIEVMEDILNHSGQKGHRDIPNYAVFDSSYFKDLPDVTKIYPLPYEYYSDYKIMRYGFHGISHKFVANEMNNKYPNANKIISIHLGGGSSVCAIENGKPVDISMGFTPLEGLMMLTRSGDIDAGIIHYLIEKKLISHNEVNEILNYKSGIFGISGIDDMRELLHVAGYKVEDMSYKPKTHADYLSKEIKIKANLALEMYIYRIKKYIGAYYAINNGCDILVFTGSVASGSSVIRNKIIEGLDLILHNVKIEIIEADEERQIANEIINIIRG